jgi:transposase-like protein
MSVLDKPYFRSEKAAFKHLEKLLWPECPVCPHCGSCAQPYDLAKTRIGLRKCREKECRKQFTVRVGTVFESSHIKLHIWMQAAFLLCSSKKGMSAHQLHRTLEVTYKTAWFMAHRLREAMKAGGLPPIGGEGETVQVDETYFGTIDALRGKTWAEKKGHSKKMSVVTLVNKGKSRTFHVETANAATIQRILSANVKKETVLHTDESRLYKRAGREFAGHESVHHAKGEYVRGNVHINTAENYFSVFKRGMRGVYQHCSEKHLQRYLDEFDFRYNRREITDSERSDLALMGIVGKRLTYRQSSDR